MKYQIEYRSFTGVFAVPEQVRSLLYPCSGTALKVLLCILAAPKEPIAVPSLCAQLGLAPDDVEEALTYWVQNGLLCVRESFGEQPPAPPVQTAAPALSAPQQPQPQPPQPQQPPSGRVRRITSKRTLPLPEIARLSQTDPNIPAMLQEAQSLLGRTLSSPETEMLCSFYAYDHLSPAYLMLVLMYCIERGKTSFRYVEKVIHSMLEQEIDTYEGAESYLARASARQTSEQAVRTAFGIHERALTAQEKKYIATWFEEFHFDIAMVRLAYERTIDSIGRLSFPYINSILVSWHGKGITSTKEAAQEAPPQRSTEGRSASSIDMDELEYYLNHGKKP